MTNFRFVISGFLNKFKHCSLNLFNIKFLYITCILFMDNIHVSQCMDLLAYCIIIIIQADSLFCHGMG